MPTNTSVHEINEYDNITTSSISPSRLQPLSFSSSLKKGQQANYDYQKENLNENNKNFTSHKTRNFNFIKEHVAHHRNYSQNRSVDRKTTFSTTSLLTKTNKLIKTPIKTKKTSNENSFLLNNKATHPLTTTKTKVNHHHHHRNHQIPATSLTEQLRTSSTSTKNNSTSSEDYFRLFEKLKSKAEYFADKDPAFTARLLDFAKYFSKVSKPRTPKMDPSYYASTYNQHYPHSSIYSVHSNFTQPQQQQQPTSNIYSTFASNIFIDQNATQNSYRATSKTKPQDSPRTSPKSSKHGSKSRQSSYNTYSNNSSGYKTSSNNTTNHNNIYSNYYNYNQNTNANPNNQYTYASYHNTKDNKNSEDIFLVLEDAYEPNKRIVQMTRTILGPDGEQQRVTVERDFKNEIELNAFLKQFGENMNKPSYKSKTKTAPSSSTPSSKNRGNNTDDFTKSPGVVVVEEPGEEPKLYRQDTGELVSNSSFTDPLVDGENNENPEELPKGKEKAKYASNTHSKIYKDIDELIENLRNEDSSLKNENEKKTSESDKTKSFNGRRNSIHMTNSQKEKNDKKEKRYSYNPREEKPDHKKSSPKIDSDTKVKVDRKGTPNVNHTTHSEKPRDHTSYKKHETSSDKSKTESISTKAKIPNSSTTREKSSHTKKQGNKKIDTILENLAALDDRLPKKIFRRSEMINNEFRPRSCSTKPSSGKIRHHRTFNEKDLMRPTTSHNMHRSSLSEKKPKTYYKEHTESKYSSKVHHSSNLPNEPEIPIVKKSINTDGDSKPIYNRPGNRVSFQPSTEFLKYYKNAGISKQGAATAMGIKRAASASSCKKNSLLPKSESAVSYSKNELINKFIEKHEKKISHTVNYSKLKSAELLNERLKGKNDIINNLKPQYSSMNRSSSSDCSTIDEPINQPKSAFRRSKLVKNYSLNVSRNISKSVDSVLVSNFDEANDDCQKKVEEPLKENWRKKKFQHSKPNLPKLDRNLHAYPKTCTEKEYPRDKSYCEHKFKSSQQLLNKSKPPIKDSSCSDSSSVSVKVKPSENSTTLKEERPENDEETNSEIFENNENNMEDDFYVYDQNVCQAQNESFYARQNQIYSNFRQTQASPAFFQPGFYPRSNTPQPQPLQDIQSSHSQNVFGHYQQQQQVYFNRQSNYYASWYGSTPSLRVPDRNQNRQSFYFN